MLFSLVACGQQAEGSNQTQDQGQEGPAQTPDDNTGTQAPETEQPEEEAPQTGSEGGKTLVVYYSATGNTEAVAQTIADTAGADLFELEPSDPYTDEDLDWTDDNSRVTQEYEDTSLRDVELTADTVENWEEYDTVFIGYPIWWGIAAWPVNDFIQANDFTGKTVIPFATSSSSGMGESGELLAELAGTGDWQEGQRFRSGADEADVAEWVNSLGLAA
ncbi:MAG TPA: flavodoxin [Firmicutes bacterium]|nr:flavodoxin [Bacillota bacterium]